VNNLDPFRLASALSDRIRTLSEFERQRQDQAEAEARLATALLEAIPPENTSLRRFVREQQVIEVLLMYGKYSDRYGYNLPGLRNYKQVAAAVEVLRSVWKDNVIITIDEPGEQGRVSIRYFVAPHIY